MNDEKIDLVYTWVDDTDKVWLEKRKNAANAPSLFNEVFNTC